MKFTVSILCYTQLQLAKRCIQSVLQNSPPDVQLILTANGNPEAAAYFAELASRFSNIRVVVNSENLGFIEPNRRALAMCETEYFLLLNDDATVPPGWLDKLEAPFLKDPRCAISGAKGTCQSLDETFMGRPGGPVDYIEGSCLMILTGLAKKFGLFSEYLHFAYCEDADLCLRMREQGYTVHQADFSLAHHVRGATSKHIPNLRAIMERNFSACRQRWAYYLRRRQFNQTIIVRREAARGDVLRIDPIIRALKHRQPLAEIWVETVCPEALANHPLVKATNSRLLERKFPHCRVVDLNGSYEKRPELHPIDAYALSAGLRADEYDKVIHFTVSEKAKSWGGRQEMPANDLGWVAIGPGPTSWKCRNWPFERWNHVSEGLMRAGYKVLGVGADRDPPLACTLDLRTKTDTDQLAAVLAKCRLFIGLDSFPIHVAQSQKVPVLGVFGLTTPSLVLTDGSTWKACCSDPAHPATGLRHRSPNKTFVDYPNNPMLTIEAGVVLAEALEMLKP